MSLVPEHTRHIRISVITGFFGVITITGIHVFMIPVIMLKTKFTT
jgi:hypothetical protein